MRVRLFLFIQIAHGEMSEVDKDARECQISAAFLKVTLRLRLGKKK